MFVCVRCRDRVGISSDSIVTDEYSVCALCMGLLQDSVIDAILQQVPHHVARYTTKSRKLPTAVKIAVSLPTTIVAREYAMAAHLKCSDPTKWEAAKDICKRIIAEKLNVLLKDYNIAPMTDEYDGKLQLYFDFKHKDEKLEVALLDIPPVNTKQMRSKRHQHFQREQEEEVEEDSNLGESKDFDDDSNFREKKYEPVADSLKSVNKFFSNLTVEEFARTRYPIPPLNPSEGISCIITTKHDPLYLFGRYTKNSRELSQTHWIKGNSVEEQIIKPLHALFNASGTKFSSAGREDADVRMLGNGRHFVIQFMDPHSFPDLDGESIANLINEQSAGIIRVSEIKVTEDESVMEILKEGEESKTKLYRAVIWIEKSITGEQFAQLPSDPFEIIQETPIRVSHRRSLLPRPRTVHSLKFEQISNHFVIMNIEGGAGMYIKEFVHGDRGRTSPSISEMFSCNADILQLDVVDIQYSS